MAVVVTINPAGIQSLVSPGGSVWLFTRKIGRDTTRLAKVVHAPRGTGELRRQIGQPEMSTGPYLATARVTSRARHSLWVHEGTTGPITRPGGGWMPIHSPSRSSVLFYARSVRGQAANPFLARSLEESFRLNVHAG